MASLRFAAAVTRNTRVAFRWAVESPRWFGLACRLVDLDQKCCCDPFVMPRCRRSVFVTNRSSPTNCSLFPRRSERSFQLPVVFLQPSLIERSGSGRPVGQEIDHAAESSCLPSIVYFLVLESKVRSATSRAMWTWTPAYSPHFRSPS